MRTHRTGTTAKRRTRRAWPLGLTPIAVAAGPSEAVAQVTTFSFTGDEQSYTVPAGIASVRVSATGGAGGTPPPGAGLTGGRAATVTGVVAVTAGQVLYVHVGGSGGL